MKRTVVLCGSLGTTATMWEGQLPLFAGWDVIAVDHPGHGGTPPAPVATVSDLAERVLGLVDADRFSFVGLSLGGAVGMRIALDEPDRVERLVLSCTAARFGDPQQWRDRADVVRSDGTAAIVEAVLARWFTPAFAGVDRFREMFLATDREAYARCCDALAVWDVRAELEALNAPTLVIAGADDPSTPPALVEDVAGAIPGARFQVLEHAAHLAPVERAQEFNRLLKEHL